MNRKIFKPLDFAIMMKSNPDRLCKINIISDNEVSMMYEIRRPMEIRASSTHVGANFMLLDPKLKMYYKVPVEEISGIMKHLLKCYKNGIPNYMYEFPDICKTSDDQHVSSLFFEFKIEKKSNYDVKFGSIMLKFCEILFKDIIQENLVIPKETITHFVFALGCGPVYEATTEVYTSKYRVVIPTIMTTPEVRFAIYDRLCKRRSLLDLFNSHFDISFRQALQSSKRLSPLALLGSCDYELGEPYQTNEEVFCVIVEGKCQDTIVDENGKHRHDMVKTLFTRTIDDSLAQNIIHTTSVNYQPEDQIIMKRVYQPTKEFEQYIEKLLMEDKAQYQIAYDHAQADFVVQLANEVANNDPQCMTMKQVYDLLKLLGDHRFKTLESWDEILRCLAFNGDYYRSVAIIITKERCKQFSHLQLFEQHWEESKDKKYHNKYTPTAIKYWAICDSETLTMNYNNDVIQKMMLQDIVDPFIQGQLGHDNFASYLKVLLANEFITIDIDDKHTKWYEFVTSRSTDIDHGQMFKWRPVSSEPDRLMIAIGDTIRKIATSVYNQLVHEKDRCSNEEKDESRVKYLKSLIKTFMTHNRQLSAITFKQSIVRASIPIFKNNTFMKNLDKIENVLGVGNGILEFQKEHVNFIDHHHNYPISLYTETNYKPYDPNDKYVITMWKVLKTLVPENEFDALEFLLYYFSTSLDWHPKESLFFIIQGGGSNGKSFLMDLFNRTLGNAYAKKLPLSFITDLTTEKSGAANPTIMDLEYARMASYSESEKNEKVNISKIKEITGGELISARALYREQKNFRVNCNHIVTTNHCFSLQTTEHAVWRRFKLYKFKIRFVPKNPIPGTYDRLGDRELTEKIKSDKRYQEAFLSILVHYRSKLYRDYGGNILKVPCPTIEKETEEYRLSQDIYQKFIMQNLYYSTCIEPQPLSVLVHYFRQYCQVELQTPLTESTENLMATFKNAEVLQKHIYDKDGILMLKNVYTTDTETSLAPNSMLFSKWLKRDTQSESTQES